MTDSAPILLLSMPQMADPNFSRTVVLLCDYTEEGAFGLVVNRQMEEPAWTLVKTEPPVRVDPDLKLWIGGPVEPQLAPQPEREADDAPRVAARLGVARLKRGRQRLQRHAVRALDRAQRAVQFGRAPPDHLL